VADSEGDRMDGPDYYLTQMGAVVAAAGVLVGLVWAGCAAVRRGRKKRLRNRVQGGGYGD
jgi:hypothetical protein